MLAVCFYKLDCNYLKTFATLTEINCGQSELDCDHFETGLLPPGNLCNQLLIKSGFTEVERAQRSAYWRPVDHCNYLQLVSNSKKIESNHFQTSFFPSCKEAVVLFLL